MEKGRYLLINDLCICCGAPVPEGEQLCWSCRRRGQEELLSQKPKERKAGGGLLAVWLRRTGEKDR